MVCINESQTVQRTVHVGYRLVASASPASMAEPIGIQTRIYFFILTKRNLFTHILIYTTRGKQTDRHVKK